jgi:F-type H+-transporting ATPase subunit b
MLIVNKLLFGPMLKLMDERNKIIENAAHKKTDMENAQREYEEKLTEAAENAKKSESERAEAMLSEARTKAAEKIKNAEEISKKRLELAKTDVEFEDNELDTKLNENVDKLAEAFISHLIS